MTVSVEVVSDVVCPFCFIGARNLDLALERRPDVAVDVVFRPFLLDPSLPSGGDDLRARLRAKFGAEPEPMFRRVEGMAQAAGLPLDFAKVRRYPSTVLAHTLLRRAAEAPQGHALQRDLARALFRAYFLEERDIGDVETLASIASAHGITADDARGWLTDEREREATRVAAAEQSRRGVRGVPFFVFGDRYAVSGAQPPEVLVQALERAQSEA